MKKGVKETLMDTKNFKNLCDRLLKKYGFKEWSFNVHESKIEEIED